jgi:hypothetical protein
VSSSRKVDVEVRGACDSPAPSIPPRLYFFFFLRKRLYFFFPIVLCFLVYNPRAEHLCKMLCAPKAHTERAEFLWPQVIF